MSERKDALRKKLQEFEKYGPKFERAMDVVLAGGIKESVFLPSGRKVFTVVGTLGDDFIDPERPYCSCSSFFFHVLGGKEKLCYHLIGFKVAERTGSIDVIEFSDEEYGPYLSATIRDVFEVLRKSGS